MLFVRGVAGWSKADNLLRADETFWPFFVCADRLNTAHSCRSAMAEIGRKVPDMLYATHAHHFEIRSKLVLLISPSDARPRSCSISFSRSDLEVTGSTI